jgi:hypothetical protein
MGGEELPRDVGGRDVIPADAQARSHVMAASDGVKRSDGTVLTARMRAWLLTGYMIDVVNDCWIEGLGRGKSRQRIAFEDKR